MDLEHPLRVALISEHASPLAMQIGPDTSNRNDQVVQLASALGQAGHRVELLTRRDDPMLPTVFALQPGVHVHHIEAGPPRPLAPEAMLEHMPAFARAAQELLQRQPVELIHVSSFLSGWVGLALQRHLRLPLITSFHALGLVRRDHHLGIADGYPPERVAIERSLARRSDVIVAECLQDRADLERLYGAPPERIVTVPCGVDTDEFYPGSRPAARERLGLRQHDFMILQVGRIAPRKGIDNIIEAMALLPQQVPARLYVVGGAADPDEREATELLRLRRLARLRDLGDRVHFMGRRERHQLRDWYVATNVFVSTPWYEPLGITPLEAMACGTPVIGSAVGGIRHSVVDGLTGYHIPPRDPGALALRLMQLHANPAKCAALGHAGIERVNSRYTWEQVAARLVPVYALLRRGSAALAHVRAAAAEALPTLAALSASSGDARAAL